MRVLAFGIALAILGCHPIGLPQVPRGGTSLVSSIPAWQYDNGQQRLTLTLKPEYEYDRVHPSRIGEVRPEIILLTGELFEEKIPVISVGVSFQVISPDENRTPPSTVEGYISVPPGKYYIRSMKGLGIIDTSTGSGSL